MTAPKPALTLANIFSDTGKYLGVVFARGRGGFESFDAQERSLGLFPTAKEAADALLKQKAPAVLPPGPLLADESAGTFREPPIGVTDGS